MKRRLEEYCGACKKVSITEVDEQDHACCTSCGKIRFMKRYSKSLVPARRPLP